MEAAQIDLNVAVLNLFVEVVRDTAEIHYGMQIMDDDIIRQGINTIAEDIARIANRDGVQPLVRAAPPGVGQLLNQIIREIQMIQNQPQLQNINQGQQLAAEAEARAAAAEAEARAAAAGQEPHPDVGESISPPKLANEVPHPPRGGSRKVKKTKSSNKRPTARRRHRSSKAARKARKARSTRRR